MPTAVFGNAMGPIYPLGLFTVVTAHTVIPLSTNVPITTGFGTSGSASPAAFDSIKVMAPSANTGDVYLVFKSQPSNGTGGTSVILSVPKGQEREITATNTGGPFTLDQLGIDADNNGDKAYVTCTVG